MSRPTLAEIFRVFGRIGVLSFGGPAAQMALMHRELVEERPWLSEDDYLRALSFCMLLPGPEAMQLATYAGWRLRGVVGGVLAGLLFVMPGALVILGLAMAYGAWGSLPITQSAFLGVKAAVVVVVMTALFKLAKKTLTSAPKWTAAILSFVAIYALSLPFPALIALAAAWGYAFGKAPPQPPSATQSARSPYKAALACAVLWAVPLGGLLIWGPDLLAQLALFFSKLAVVTFGGAYAVLAYMTQATVQDFGWLATEEMIDALGLAETTPGPLILVTEFVGFLAAFKEGGLWYGVLGAAITLWMTFVPCFLWIFLAAGHVESLTQKPRLSNALNFVTAAVVGVIFNLGLWFAINIWFTKHHLFDAGPFHVLLPDLTSLDPVAILLTALSAGLLIVARLSLVTVLGLLACTGIVLSVL